MGAPAKTGAGGLLAVSMFRTQIRDAVWRLEGGTGRDNLDKNPPQIISAKRTRVVGGHAFEHLVFAGRLHDRAAGMLLETPNGLREPRPFREQLDELQIDLIDLFAQLVERLGRKFALL